MVQTSGCFVLIHIAGYRTCDSRKYTYFFPSYLMIPPKPGSGLDTMLKTQGVHSLPHTFWESVLPEQENSPQDDLRRKRECRVTPEQLAALRESAKKFEGSHNFHNFTVGREFKDRSCQRFLKSIEVRFSVTTATLRVLRKHRFWTQQYTETQNGSRYYYTARALCSTR